MSNRLGLKYGGGGLVIRVWIDEDITQDLGKVVLTRDPKAIFSFLDLDYDKWLQGFKDELEIFQFVTRSRYFSPWYYYQASGGVM